METLEKTTESLPSAVVEKIIFELERIEKDQAKKVYEKPEVIVTITPKAIEEIKNVMKEKGKHLYNTRQKFRNRMSLTEYIIRNLKKGFYKA